jgi:plasmid maintenance system antidote protein VapI
MKSTSKINEYQIRYYRRLRRNRVFSELLAYFAHAAENGEFRKKDLAQRLGKDPAQITRYFSEPANLTLDTVSDLLLAMGAEMEFKIAKGKSGEMSVDDFMTEFQQTAGRATDETVLAVSKDSPVYATSSTLNTSTADVYEMRAGNE